MKQRLNMMNISLMMMMMMFDENEEDVGNVDDGNTSSLGLKTVLSRTDMLKDFLPFFVVCY